uniref:Inter-alpha-trypsin inhibitor heavy chain 2 n=1 Tax=Lepisosteus oculatus TaxID=7918 RepID=W5NF90_LEPOC|nr:PREDICTED: inter-alpha-trypsin inhibitor heavy chain H2 [Lepisosteus oculatus]
MRHLAVLIFLLFVSKVENFHFFIDGSSLEETYLTESSQLGESESKGSLPRLINRFEKNKRSVITSPEEEELETKTEDGILIPRYKVEARITSRFAHTSIHSQVINSAHHAQSIAFDVQIPKTAFISNFTMNVNGIVFVGSVKDKTIARNLYSQARARGKAAGIVRTNAQDMETFKCEVNVPSGSRIEFELHYQEMMQRRLGRYEYNVNLQPGRLVKNFQVDVYIFEPSDFAFIESTHSLGKQFDGITKITQLKQKAHVSFKPTLTMQRKCENCSSTAINGVFTVGYDVNRDTSSGELMVSDGYFVHFFAPTYFSPLPKDIVFVIDVSGSMWGLKMKQTVQAMLTILDDLSPDDSFSIIDFNHNVRCWNEELVPGNSIQIAEAKRYIQAIQPNGGTNINEALLRAIHMLSKARSSCCVDSKAVSMIILVSDGDPTVGEIKLKNIQKNVKKAMREEFSLFSLGIGFDVDYDFLERIALENRGKAQRIRNSEDASEQLRKFYIEVSSPLLRKIEITFPEDTVLDVTQNSFDKYFSGSELVTAGRVKPNGFSVLQGTVTASSAEMDLQLLTETDIHKLDELLALGSHTYPDFAKQLWAYITINQLLAERSLAPTAARKRKITQKILSLALQHQFVTPMTAMLVESEDGSERILADSPKDPKQGCCSGSVSLGLPVNRVHSIPPWAQSPLSTPGYAVGPTPEVYVPSHITTVDSDPHFIIHLPKSNTDICFNIDSEPGDVLNLISDPDSGVVVNGQLIGAKKSENKKLSTYFGTILIYYKPLEIKVEISTEHISITDAKYAQSFSWTETGNVTQTGVKILIKKDTHVIVSVNSEISFMVLLHRVWKKHPVNVDFLGFYTPNSNMYSPKVHGLIGQFATEPEVKIFNIHPGEDPKKPEATMEVKGNKLAVTRGWQKDYRDDKVYGTDIYCWFIHNSGKGFIDGHYKNYIVPQLDSFLQQF